MKVQTLADVINESLNANPDAKKMVSNLWTRGLPTEPESLPDDLIVGASP